MSARKLSIGLFTRSELSARSRSKKAKSAGLPVERLHAMECQACPLNTAPGLRHPKMSATGERNAKLYILGEAPGETEDARGRQFVGKSGKLLRSVLRDDADEARWNNSIRCRPPDNRNPSDVEIECCRPSIAKDIEKTAPAAVLCVGGVPLKWFGASGGITVWRGRRFPAKVNGHTTWVYPTFHPSFVQRKSNPKRRGMDEYERVFRRDIKRTLQELDKLPEPRVFTEEELESGTTCYTGERGDLEKLKRHLERLKKSDVLGADVETHGLRCYAEDALLLSIAIASEDSTAAIALEHDEAKWSPAELREVYELIRDVFTSGSEITWHNGTFDLEWVASRLGTDVLFEGNWHDTYAMSYVLDGRKSTLSLDFTAFEFLGIRIKGLSNVDRKNLRFTKLLKLLRYNAIDARTDALLSPRMYARIDELGLSDVYLEQARRVATIVAAQMRGVLSSQRAVRTLDNALRPKIDGITSRLNETPGVKQFRNIKGTYNPNSSADNTVLFRDILKRSEGAGKSKKKGYSTDDAVLERIAATGSREASLLQEYREFEKLHSTYVARAMSDHPETFIWPDGRIHTSYDPCRTSTRRLAASEPNVTNFPKRKHREVRRIVRVGRDFWLVAVDQGQIEARIIANTSGDKRFIKALFDRYDIHMEWAERIAAAIPRWKRMHGGVMKTCRAYVKNQFVFPSFYGAGAPRVSLALGISDQERKIRKLQDRFHGEFDGVSKWRDDTVKFYEKHGYVETSTGFRRYAPMSFTELVNAPIQGTASDMVVDAWCRLAERAYEEEKPYLVAPLEIHDDLTFELPRSETDEAIKVIVHEMMTFDYGWLRVPLCVEVEIGRNWCDMTKYGVFYSDEV